MDVWVQREVAGCEFPDQRLKTRLGKLMTDLGNKIGSTVPTACQDWAATKAAYRFFDNPRVDESMILSGHFEATRSRIARTPDTILVLHDTTEFSFQRDRPDAIGRTHLLPSCLIGQQPITEPHHKHDIPNRNRTCCSCGNGHLRCDVGEPPDVELQALDEQGVAEFELALAYLESHQR